MGDIHMEKNTVDFKNNLRWRQIHDMVQQYLAERFFFLIYLCCGIFGGSLTSKCVLVT